MNGELKFVGFNLQAFETAKRYLEAAERLGEPQPDSDGALNVLIAPSHHCAVLACELFLKSLNRETQYVDHDGNTLPHASETVGIEIAKVAERTHKKLFDALSEGPVKDALQAKLDDSDITFLNEELWEELQKSRYPYEYSGNPHSDRALSVGRKLREVLETPIVRSDQAHLVSQFEEIEEIEENSRGKKMNVRPTLGVLAVALRDGAALLVQRANPPDQHLWGFPGGKVEPGETVAEAAVRELEEETGLSATPGPELGTKEIIRRDASGALRHHFFLVAVLCEGAAGTPVADDDAAAARWVPDAEIHEGRLPMSDGVARLLKAARATAR
jgi:8-oxo-dGTP diphosphatase